MAETLYRPATAMTTTTGSVSARIITAHTYTNALRRTARGTTQYTCAGKLRPGKTILTHKTTEINPNSVVGPKAGSSATTGVTKTGLGQTKALHKTLPTPIKLNKLVYHLRDYPQKDYIINGFKQGFSLHFEGPQLATTSGNSQSTVEYHEKIDKKIKEEVKMDRISGPYPSPPLPFFKVTPLSARPKKEPGKVRLLHNLSHPYNSSAVNYNIPKHFASVTYQSISDAVDIINRLGKGCFLAKSDIESAFRLLPLRPSEYNLTGFYWEGYYFEKVLPMGSSSSCFIFEKFSDSLQYILYKKGVVHTVKVIDDFLIAGKDELQCMKNLQTFIELMGELGVPLAPHKTHLPSTRMEF